jgi:hypothetical protein
MALIIYRKLADRMALESTKLSFGMVRIPCRTSKRGSGFILRDGGK